MQWPQDRRSSLAERYAVFPPCLHTLGGNGPQASLQIDFRPCGADDLAGAGRSQFRLGRDGLLRRNRLTQARVIVFDIADPVSPTGQHVISSAG